MISNNSSKELIIQDLLVEYLEEPLGLDTLNPRFSWKLKSGKRGQRQTAYLVLVASSYKNIKDGKGDIWDSGKVKSFGQSNIRFEGSKLKSRTKYYWKVKVWDKDNRLCPESKVSTFETGILNGKEWQGEWITQSSKNGGIFRKEVDLNKKIKRARAYVIGLGYYEFRINGKKVGCNLLEPAQTDYDKTLLYTSYDITDLLKEGSNTLGIILGNGRYSFKVIDEENLPLGLKKFGKYPITLVQIYLEFDDGKELSIHSDSSWKVTSGPIVFDSIYDGEIYDANFENEGWNSPGFDDRSWKNAAMAIKPKGKLKSSTILPPIRLRNILKPKKITSPKRGIYVVDFGQNFSGWIKINLKCKKDEKIIIKYAELIGKDGMVDMRNLRNAKATDIYICKGGKKEIYEPRFTYHGFRYVQIEGLLNPPSMGDIEGLFINSSVEQIGSFICSNPLVNKIHKMALWSTLSNLYSIPTDSPQRDERLGWLGDAHLMSEVSMLNLDMLNFYTKFLNDIRDSQSEDGDIPDVVPNYLSNGFISDPVWGSAAVIIPWYCYLYYEDKKILEENYRMMVRWLNHVDKEFERGERKGYLGDWCPPGNIESVNTDGRQVALWYYYYCYSLISKISKIIGNQKDSQKFTKKANEIKKYYNTEFFKDYIYGSYPSIAYKFLNIGDSRNLNKNMIEEFLKGCIGVSCQTSNSLALYLDIVPKDKENDILETMLTDIINRHSNHISTGIVGARYILEVLAKYDYEDIAYKMITNDTYPGWGYMIKEGATTLWERWEYLDGNAMNSHNHQMFGAVDSFFYKVLAGINVDEGGPGFKNIIINPKPTGDLKYVKAAIDTIRGEVLSSWERDDKFFSLKVSIPVGSTAKIYVPKIGFEKVELEENGIRIWNGNKATKSIPYITNIQARSKYIELNVDSGTYNFKMIRVK